MPPDPKHLELGLDPADLGDEDPESLDPDDTDAIDEVWADATTVEQYKADIETLAGR